MVTHICRHTDLSKNNPMCIFNVLNSVNGFMIRDRMLEWLTKYYTVTEIQHDGTQYEFHGLKYLQDFCKDQNKPALYIHTRGAVNFWNTTEATHRMWEIEFGQNRDKYFELVNTDEPTCACPFTSPDKHTFYNGFVVNAAAMCAIQEIQPSEDRIVFEDIFKDSCVNVIGTKTQNCIQEAREYLKTV